MSEPHKISEPNELDVYRENQRLAYELSESEKYADKINDLYTLLKMAKDTAEERAEKAERELTDSHFANTLAVTRTEAAEADRDALKKERNAALSLAEQRGAAYDIADGLRREAEADRDALLKLIEQWREGRAYLGVPMTYVDQRLVDETRTFIGDKRAAGVKP